MAETQQQQLQQQQQERQNEKNNVPPSRNATAVNNGAGAANNTAASSRFLIDGLRVNPRYFTTIPGILKIVEWVLAIICIACGAPALLSAIHWFLFVVVILFIATFLWMCVHFFTITSIFAKVPWTLLETIYTAVATILYFIAMVVMLQQSDRHKPWLVINYGQGRWDTYIAAGVFSLFNTVVYAVETAFHFKEWVDSRQE